MNSKEVITMKGITISFLILGLAFVTPLAPADTGQLHAVSGSIHINGTRVKTEGPKSRKEVVVYLEKMGEQAYPAPPTESILLDQKGLVFIPHVMAIQKGTTVEFLNSDTTEHNVFCADEACVLVGDIDSKKPKFLDLGNFAGGQKASYTFDLTGEAVMLCKLHPEMAAYIIVLETPYFTVAEIDGATQTASFSIDGVPPGKYVLRTWNKWCESKQQEITVSADSADALKIDMQRKQRKRKTGK